MSDDNQELPNTMGQEIAAKKAQDAKNADIFSQLIDHAGSDYIPWERVDLPSGGIYYGDKMPGGFLEVKPMGVDVDKMLTNQRLIQSGQLLNKLIESCTRLPPNFSVREMLAGDFNYLLYYIRGITHGPTYEFSAECPHCGTKNIYEFDLGLLQETIKVPNPNYPDEDSMVVELPQISKTFGKQVFAMVRLIRVDDIMKMSQPDGGDHIYDPVEQGRVKIRNKKKSKGPEIKNNQQDLSKMYEDNMKTQIVGFEVDGERFTDGRKAKLIDRLHQQDAAVIRDFIEEISPGIDTSLEITCVNKDCRKEATISLPWNENFFRPNKGN